MKLIAQVSRHYKDKKYHKHWVIIPNRLIEKLGWNEGDELKAEIEGKRLVVERQKKK